MEERIIELETRVAFQEQALAELNEALIGQQRQLDRLQSTMDATLRQLVAPADPINSAQLIAPRPVLMLNAKHDLLVNPFSNKLLFARLNPPKKIVWFDDDHGLPGDIALDYALKFFDAYLRGDRDPAEIGTQITGHNTTPLNMKIGKPLPEIVTEMPLDDLFDYEDFLQLNAVRTPLDSVPGYSVSISYLSMHDETVQTELLCPPPLSGFMPFSYLITISDQAFMAPGQTFISHDFPLLPPNTCTLNIKSDYFWKHTIMSGQQQTLYLYTIRDSIMQNIFDAMRAADYLTQDHGVTESKPVLIAQGAVSHRIALIAAAHSGAFSAVILLPDDNGDTYENFRKSLIDSGRGDEAEKSFYWFEPSFFGKPTCYAVTGVANSFHCEKVDSLTEALEK